MSKVITYKVTRAKNGGYNVDSVTKDVDASGWSTTEEGAILAFKDSVTMVLPNESTFIFVTETQAPAMEDYSEMEKHGESPLRACIECLEDPCQCCKVCKGLCRGH